MRTISASGFVALAIMSLSGCGGPELIPTPNLYIDSEENPFAGVPAPFQNNKVDVLYVTDRRPVQDDDGTLEYDHGRSPSMAFGSAVVRFGEEVSWDDLVAASRVRDREISLPITVSNIEEKGRFPSTPYPLVEPETPPETEFGHGLVPDPAVLAKREEVAETLRKELRERLAKTPRKAAYVFIHGYNNSFDHAVSVIAQTWHFLGRIGIPIAYTWPAGLGGLRGYFYDRESGEYTIYHLKDFLWTLVSCEELEEVYLIAHSRGTDVIMTALREMWIEIRGPDLDPHRKRKLMHVIVAAPDLDLEVISQRIAAEEISKEVHRMTVYMSESDAAIGLSTWLFVSQKRIGRVTSEDDLLPHTVERTRQMQHILALVDADVSSGLIGHSYFYSHPAVLSDLILILRDDRDPGAEYGRPLSRSKSGLFWRIDDDYPQTATGENDLSTED